MSASFPAIGAAGNAGAASGAFCFRDFAETHGYTLGLPVKATPTPDGEAVLFLRSGPRDSAQRLFAFDLASGRERELITPESLLGGGAEQLSTEEKARRERARITATGFVDYALSPAGDTVLVPFAGRLHLVDRVSGKAASLPGEGWIGPKFAPDGKHIAGVRDGELHVVDLATGTDRALTKGAGPLLTHGVAEFVAQEEMGREDGFWWSPDSRLIAYEEAELGAVEPHYIADPAHPERPPVAFRYPRAGTPNAEVKLGVVAAQGGPTVWVRWDAANYPYLARVVWGEGGPLTLVVENRRQTEALILAADPASGATRLLWKETDAAFLELEPPGARSKPDMPRWLPDSSAFLWASERSGQWQLELHRADGALAHAVTPDGFRYDGLADLDAAHGSVVVSGGYDRLSRLLYRVPLAGGAPQPLDGRRGIHEARFGHQHAIYAHLFDLADGSRGTDIRDASGQHLATLTSEAAVPPALPRVEYLTVGSRDFDAQIVRPSGFKPGARYPVILDVYGGPAAKLVWAAPQLSFQRQCLADQGYIVATLDGRGTPGRDRAWLRAIAGNAIDIPLQDQIDGLQALAARVPEMDLARVGVMGWSFGGYFSAMGVLRRPDIFKAAVAGAPVIDWADYDTHYTERYLGLPAENPDGYRASNVLTYADGLSRPLLLVHGLTDDNVYVQHTLKLVQALFAAGKPYDLLLLPGTHMLADPALRTRELERTTSFFAQHLGPTGPS